MKNKLNNIMILFLVISSLTVYSQNDVKVLDVYMVDPRIDLAKLKNNTVNAIRVVPTGNTKSGLSTPDYSFNSAKNNLDIPRNGFKKLIPLVPNPSKAIFFTLEIDINNSAEIFTEVLLDTDSPGLFMNLQGEAIMPSNTRFRTTAGYRKSVVNPGSVAGNKSQTHDNTIANLKFKDSKAARTGLKVDVPTNNPKLTITAFVTDVIIYEVRKFEKEEFLKGPFLFSIFDKNSINFDQGAIISQSTLLGQKIIELASRCKGPNQADFCKDLQFNDTFEARNLIQQINAEIRNIPRFQEAEVNLSPPDYNGLHILN